jgi:hypothetical protein
MISTISPSNFKPYHWFFAVLKQRFLGIPVAALLLLLSFARYSAPRAKSATTSNWVVRKGEGPDEYRPFCDLRFLLESHGRACTQVLFLCKAELGFFHILEIVTAWLGTFRWSEDPSTAWLVPSTTEDLAR